MKNDNQNMYLTTTTGVTSSSSSMLSKLYNATWYYPVLQNPYEQSQYEKVQIQKRRGREMQTLYDVYLIYGGDRLNPVVESKRVVACSEEEAKIKSKIQSLVKDDWDIDFVTIIVKPIGQAAVKERPTEIKSV